MRDPKRIDRVLTTIARIWKNNPDMRLGQLLQNCKSYYERDLFYVEDEELEERVQLIYGHRKNAGGDE